MKKTSAPSSAMQIVEKSSQDAQDGRIYKESFFAIDGWLSRKKKDKIIKEMIRKNTGNLDGDSLKLRINMIRYSLEPISFPFQAHHLIPSQIEEHINDISLLNIAFTRCGYDINNANNGFFLPETPFDMVISGLVFHKGKHPPEYLQVVMVLLERKWAEVNQQSKMELKASLLEIFEPNSGTKPYKIQQAQKMILKAIQFIEDQIWLLVFNGDLRLRTSHIPALEPANLTKRELQEIQNEWDRINALKASSEKFYIPKLTKEEIRTLRKIEKELHRRKSNAQDLT